MKKKISEWLFAAATGLLLLGYPLAAEAKEADTIKDGVYAGEIHLSGMTAEEATAEIQEYVDSLKDCLITLKGKEGQAVTVTAEELGIYWSNPEVVTEALSRGTKGHVIERCMQL